MLLSVKNNILDNINDFFASLENALQSIVIDFIQISYRKEVNFLDYIIDFSELYKIPMLTILVSNCVTHSKCDFFCLCKLCIKIDYIQLQP